jgi:transcriptional regulator with XRE-family HTH domain
MDRIPNYRKLFGDILRTLRRQRKLTQQAVSELLGGKPRHTTISKYEHGECLPRTLPDVENLALAVTCTVAEKKRLIAAYAKAKAQPGGFDHLLAA